MALPVPYILLPIIQRYDVLVISSVFKYVSKQTNK
jgi:hypothetical protein